MKRTLWMLLAVLAVMLVQFGATNVSAAETVPTVYLDAANGADTNDGLTEATAVKTMENAYAVLDNQVNGGTQGKIVLVSDYTVTMTAENQTITSVSHAYEVILTGKTADTKLIISRNGTLYLGLQGPTTFENITVNAAGGTENACIYGNGGHVKIGSGVKTTSKTLFKFSAGPLKSGYVGDMSLEVNSGNWQDFCAGAYMYTMNGKGSLVMNGGSVVNLEVTYNGKQTGDVTITVNGGTITNLYGGSRHANGVLTGNLTLNLNGGTVTKLLDADGLGTITGTKTLNLGGGHLTIASGLAVNVTGKANGTTIVTVSGTPTYGKAYVTGNAKEGAVLYTNGTYTYANGSFTLNEAVPMNIALEYDDRKELTAILGQAPVNVEISNEKVFSYKVGTQEKDDHVIIYENGKLIATGIGTADLTVNGTTHKVTVTSATLSLFMITGHSVGAGDGGSIGQSVLCEAGQVYSTHRPYALTSGEGGLGYGAGADRVAQKDSSGNVVDITSQQHLDAFTAEGVGTMGEGSALGYRWNQLTGEKVWVLNLAVGGSCLNEWQTGVKGHATWTEYHYDTAVKTFGYAQTIVKNEIAAGHYEFGHMAAFYHNGVNYANYPGWTYESIKADYEAMWNDYKEAFTTDMDGDGNNETLEGLGLLPFYNFVNEYNDLFDKPAGYYMASSAEYPDVFLASNIYFGWMKEEGLASFPVPNYPVQNGTTLTVPVSIAHEANGGTSTNSVFCKADNMHPTQVVHNAVGMNIADSLYAYLYNSHETQSVTLQDQAHNALTSLEMVVGEKQMLVPMITPGVKGNVTYTAEGAVSVQYPLQVVANEVGTGTITAKAGDTVLATVTVTVTENTHIHCVCGGSGAKNHSCADSTWIAWGDDAYEQGVLPFLSGNYYLMADITVSKSMLVEPGETIRICLNGHSINTGTERVANVQGYLAVTDCQEQQGTLTSTYSSKYAQIYYVYDDAVLDIYGGITDPQGQSAWGASILNHGTTNVYGGVINGDTNVLTDNLEARGGAIYIISGQVNLYGGTVNGGYATKGGAIYMDSSTLVIDGATITGGSASLGGNIYADYLSVIEIKSGLIENGSSKNQGGNLYLYTSAKDGKGRDCSLNISGGTIQNGTAADRGSNIFVTTGSNAAPGLWDITVSGGSVVGGADNVILRNNAQLTLCGGTITSLGSSIQFERSNATAPTPVLQLKDSFTLDTVRMDTVSDGMIRLVGDTTTDFTVSGNPCLDLNGYDLNKLTVSDGSTLCLFDSATNDYEGEYGTATIEGNMSSFAEYGGKTYLVVAEDGKYSAHRYEVKLTHVSLDPANDALGYKAQFYGDEVVRAHVSAFGFHLWINADNVLTKGYETAFTNGQIVTLRLKGILAANGGEMEINANAFVRFDIDQTPVTTENHRTTMKQTLQTVNANFDGYSDAQQAAVKALVEKFADKVSGWELDNITA